MVSVCVCLEGDKIRVDTVNVELIGKVDSTMQFLLLDSQSWTEQRRSRAREDVYIEEQDWRDCIKDSMKK